MNLHLFYLQALMPEKAMLYLYVGTKSLFLNKYLVNFEKMLFLVSFNEYEEVLLSLIADNIIICKISPS